MANFLGMVKTALGDSMVRRKPIENTDHSKIENEVHRYQEKALQLDSWLRHQPLPSVDDVLAKMRRFKICSPVTVLAVLDYYMHPATANNGFHPAIPYIFLSKDHVENGESVQKTTHPGYFLHCLRVSRDDEMFWIKGRNLPFTVPPFASFLYDRAQQPQRVTDESQEDARKEAKKIARALYLDDAKDREEFCRATGLLPCVALVEDGFSHPFWELMLELPIKPRQNSPVTLRSRLLEGEEPPMLARINLACSLAQSLLVLHAMGIVHKGIHPDNILLFKDLADNDNDCNSNIGQPYWIGFNHGGERKHITIEAQGARRMREKLYTHASLHYPRGGPPPRRMLQTLDDFYAFGVLLIEILSWSSFFKYDQDWKFDSHVLENATEDTPDNQLKNILAAKADDLDRCCHFTRPDIVKFCLNGWDRHGSTRRGRKVLRGEADFRPSDQAEQGLEFVSFVLRSLKCSI